MATGALIALIAAGLWAVRGLEPSPGATGDAARGVALFTSNCSQCHGDGGRGTPSGPPLVHEYYVPAHHADVAFLLAVRNGVRPHHWRFGEMPPIAGVSDTDVDDIVAYVRDLQRRAGLIESDR